jgi:uncharacterized protein
MQTTVTAKGAEHSLDLSRIAQDLQIRRVQVESVVQLLDEANTVPFITRYRKERTGGLDEELIRQIQVRVQHLRQLADRKQTILKSIEAQGKLTDDLRNAILSAETSKRLEDLYLPYKPKKRTLATIARERGLEPLAEAIWNRDPAVANLSEVLTGMVDPERELPTVEDVLTGVQHILAEKIAETAEVRAPLRSILWKSGKLCAAKPETLTEGQGLDYKDYFQFSESVRHIPPHRILAINRGEKESSLKARLEWDAEAVRRAAIEKLPLADHPHAEFLQKTLDDALTRLLLPSLEREIRRELTDEAEEHAVRVFARNLRSLLLQPPLRNRRILAIDPGFRTGCKLAALDEVGNLLDEAVIYPFGKVDKSKPRGADKGAGKKQASPPETPGGPAASSVKDESGASSAPAVASTPPSHTTSDSATSATEAATPAATPDVLVLPSAPEVVPAPVVASSPEAVPAAAQAEPHVEPGAPIVMISADSKSTDTPAPDASSGPTPPTAQASGAPVEPPSPPPREQAKNKLEELVRKHNSNVIAIGNGTACRETEELVSELIAERLQALEYVVVNEAGASVYSASAIGREEFPNFDATLRGTISIGRRLQDPLSELVKIDPQSIGVGLYQHDIHPRRLKDSLEAVIESCVNHVGVDANTASVPLLRHVSGLNQLVARELVDYRKQHGPFKNREQLLQVPSMGPVRFVQAAGFLKINGGENPLDETWVHPESYSIAQRLLAHVSADVQSLRDKPRLDETHTKLKALDAQELTAQFEVGLPTLKDIFDALLRPGRDPREDLPPPIFKKGILKLEDLQAGMELKGTVLNVVDFGAFVDVGLKDSGLVHISQMANRYIKNPYDIVSVGDVVTVWVLAVDQERRRVSLTMIRPGTQRRPPEKKPQAAEEGQGRDRPPPSRPPQRPRGRFVAVARPGQAPAAQTKNAGQTPAVVSQPPPKQPAPPAAPAAQQPPPRPRRPQRQAPKPKLSKAALEGTAPLRSFGELRAFFEAQQHVQPPPPPTEPAPKPAEGSEVSSS